MKKLEEIGECVKCQCSLSIFKTNNYKRFVKCEACGLSYPLPKRGTLSTSALNCPKNGFPVLIVSRRDEKAYFWADQPCFSCIAYDSCEVVRSLITEFTELEVYGY